MAAKALLERFASITQVLSKADIQELRLLAEVGKSLLRVEAKDLLEECPTAPCLVQYSADCTPIRTRSYYGAGKGKPSLSHSSVVTVQEYLVQLCFISVLAGETLRQKIIFRDPISLEHGKTMPSLLSCAMKFIPSQWFQDREGLVIFHQIHDRGMSRRYREALSGHFSQDASLSHTAGSSLTAHNTQLQVHLECGCALHDAHNALKWVWSMLFQKSSELLGIMFSGVQSYRSSVAKSVAGLSQWLAEKLQPLDQGQCKSEEELQAFYAALGVNADLLSQLCGDMRLHWNVATERLEVLDTFLVQAGSIDEITAMLLMLWRFPSFCASRWVTIGASCRAYLQGVATGYANLYASLRNSGIVSDFEGAAGDRLTADARVFAVVLAIVSYVPESFMTMLLADNRLLQQVEGLQETVGAELDYIETLPTSVWQLLAAHTDRSGSQLRDLTLSGAHLSMGYLHVRVFSEISELPWSLAIGDLEANLEALASATVPLTDKVAHLFWGLLQKQYPKQHLLAALKLMSGVSFSSHVTERLHSSAALVRKHHQYSHDVLSARAFVHGLRSPHPGTSGKRPPHHKHRVVGGSLQGRGPPPLVEGFLSMQVMQFLSLLCWV